MFFVTSFDCFAKVPLKGTPIPTMWSSRARRTTLKRRRSYHTTLCASGVPISNAASRTSLLKMQNTWIEKLSLGSFPNFTWPLTRKTAVSSSLSTMSLEWAAAIWKDLKGHGSAFKEGGRRRIRALDIGVTRWTINSVTGIGQNSSVLVSPFYSFSCV